MIMNTYIFRAERIIDANTEEEACEKFVDNSFDFAADAECELLTTSSPASADAATDAS